MGVGASELDCGVLPRIKHGGFEISADGVDVQVGAL